MEPGVRGMDDLAPENTPAGIEVPKPLGDRKGNALRGQRCGVISVTYCSWPAS
jgi:hypothetical protein